MKKEDKIAILGITGYMGAWVAKKLSDQGFTNIVGTYYNQEKMDDLQQRLPHIRGIRADILKTSDQEKLNEFLADVKWIFITRRLSQEKSKVWKTLRLRRS